VTVVTIIINVQFASGRKVPLKPGGCNCSHITKALEHLTGLPTPQPSLKPPTPGPQQALITHKPNGSVKKKYIIFQKEGGGGKGGIAENR